MTLTMIKLFNFKGSKFKLLNNYQSLMSGLTKLNYNFLHRIYTPASILFSLVIPILITVVSCLHTKTTM